MADLHLDVVAILVCYHGAELAEFSEQAVLVFGVTELVGKRTAVVGFGFTPIACLRKMLSRHKV